MSENSVIKSCTYDILFQDKINQIRDSRAALDTLRAEHAARLAAQAEAAERQRQMQMAAKLQAMRKKKHEYLQNKREMQMRQEQQKHQYMMASGTGFFMPGVTMQQYQPGFPNQPIYANPQFHQMIPQTTDGTIPPTGQPQISQAMALNANQIAAMSQSLPQHSNAFAMPTSAMTMSQAPMTSHIRPNMTPQQIQQMMMHQHQMRMAQPGQSVPQMFPGQVQQNGQAQPKNQPPTSMMASMSLGQPNQPQLHC
ncbi:hepatocyte growth factor-regulated tyrosine kinase substrate-like [Cydia splendana]|uniref:hepatocyte growth factor-regulated tyrosine kinase substrate-like n=1 Tax=Cydia splendana TaxID=1100963 RepID=UPI00300CAE74